MLKEQVEALIQENAILKRAVSIQHERQKEFEDNGQELQRLKQLLSQYQEQLRTLEVDFTNLLTFYWFIWYYSLLDVFDISYCRLLSSYLHSLSFIFLFFEFATLFFDAFYVAD